MGYHGRNILLTTVASLSVCTTVPAFAQVAPQAEDTTTDIIVTAQRRSENIQKVPLSVIPITAETLKSRQLNDITQLTVAAPSLQINLDNVYSIRGVGTVDASSVRETSVAFALDEVNLVSPYLIDSLLNDVQQVEVLNGPQGLLFGKNASAGLVNMTTVRPKLGEFGGSFETELDLRDTTPKDGIGSVNKGTLNVPIGNTAAVRLNGYYSTQDGGTRYVGPNPAGIDLTHKQYGGRAKILFNPTDKLSIYVIGDISRETGIFGNVDRTYRSADPTGLEAPVLAASGITAGPDNLEFGGDGNYFRNLKRGGVQAKIAYAFDNGFEISNITAWKHASLNTVFDADFNNINYVSYLQNNYTVNQYSNELRVALPSEGRLSGQAGLYYFNSPNDVNSLTAGNFGIPDAVAGSFPYCVGATVGVTPICPYSSRGVVGSASASKIRSESYAAFGQFTFRVTDVFKLIAGGRLTHDRVRQELVQSNDGFLIPLAPAGTFNNAVKATKAIWKVGAQYDVTPTIMVYGTYGTGYKGPSVNSSGVTDASQVVIKPETNRGGEIGFKSSFLDRHLIFNASLFYTKFTNFQTQAFSTATGNFITQNAAGVRTKGAEVSLTALPFKGFTLNSTASFLKSNFTNYVGAPCYPGQPNAGCSTTGSFDASGYRTPSAPKFTMTAQAAYEHQIDRGIDAFVTADIYHRSTINFLGNAAPGATLRATNLLGFSAGLKGEKGWRLSIFCRNCTDQRVPAGIALDLIDSVQGHASYLQGFSLNSFRTLGLAGSVEF